MKRREFRAFRDSWLAALRRLRGGKPDGYYDEQGLPAYTNPNPFMRWVFWRRLWHVIRTLDRLPGSDMALDFGAGLGLMLPVLMQKAGKVRAVEIDAYKLGDGLDALGFPRENVIIDRALEGFLPSHKGGFGLILALDSLEHVEDLDGVLRSLCQLLSPDGRLIVSGPTETPLYRAGRWLAGYSGQYHLRGIREVERAMAPRLRVVTKKRIFRWAPLFVVLEARL